MGGLLGSDILVAETIYDLPTGFTELEYKELEGCIPGRRVSGDLPYLTIYGKIGMGRFIRKNQDVKLERKNQ